MSVSLLLACDPRVSTEDHLSTLRAAGVWSEVLISTAGCGESTIHALRKAAPSARVVEGSLCSPAEVHQRVARHASHEVQLLVRAGRPVTREHLQALVAGLSAEAAACIGVVSGVSVLDAVLGGHADLSCLAVRRSLWTRVPGIRELKVGLLGVLAVRAALLRECTTVAWSPPERVSVTHVADLVRSEARTALEVREQLAVLHHVLHHLTPQSAGPAVTVALRAVLSRLDPWVRHRQALYNQGHTTAWIHLPPDGTPVLPGLVAPVDAGSGDLR